MNKNRAAFFILLFITHSLFAMKQSDAEIFCGKNLLAAAQAGSLVDVEQILSLKDADINFANDMGSNALHCAIFSGNVDLIELLVNKGMDINRTTIVDTFHKMSMLHFALMYKKDVSVFQKLIDLGANIDAKMEIVDAKGSREYFAHELAYLFACSPSVESFLYHQHSKKMKAVSRAQAPSTLLDIAKENPNTFFEEVVQYFPHIAIADRFGNRAFEWQYFLDKLKKETQPDMMMIYSVASNPDYLLHLKKRYSIYAEKQIINNVKAITEEKAFDQTAANSEKFLFIGDSHAESKLMIKHGAYVHSLHEDRKQKNQTVILMIEADKNVDFTMSISYFFALCAFCRTEQNQHGVKYDPSYYAHFRAIVVQETAELQKLLSKHDAIRFRGWDTLVENRESTTINDECVIRNQSLIDVSTPMIAEYDQIIVLAGADHIPECAYEKYRKQTEEASQLSIDEFFTVSRDSSTLEVKPQYFAASWNIYFHFENIPHSVLYLQRIAKD